MSPGMLTSRNHGGFGFRHNGGGLGTIAVPSRAAINYGARDYGARSVPGARQRFSIGGDGKITLDPGEQLVVSVDEDGAVTIGVGASEPANGSDGLARGARRGLFGRVADKMAVSSNSDGSITVRPEGDAALQIVGDPLSGAITIVEIEPEPLNVPPAQ